MTTDDVMSCDPPVPPPDAPGLPDWITAPEPTDPFALRDLPAWATQPTSLHQPCTDRVVDDPPPSETGVLRDMEPFREAVAKLRAAGPNGGVFTRETPTGWGTTDMFGAYAAAAADHAAGVPLPAVQPPAQFAAVPPSRHAAAQPPTPPAADRSGLIGRHRSGEPPSRRARGVAAVLPWNWFRR